MSDSDLSDLSSELSSPEDIEEELHAKPARVSALDAWLKNGTNESPPPPKRKRAPSPPHEYMLADNPTIAFIVMFRARFASAFPRFVPSLGPQDIENCISGTPPGELAEKILCGFLGLVLNRKKDVERGHYGRALEEAISTNRHQWPPEWQRSPVAGDASFNAMTAEQRLTLLKALALWALNTSEAIQAVIKESYKQSRHEDDLNQPLSVQPWGRDGDKRRYWLIEGHEDTHFRLYRESNPVLRTNTWWSVAASIEDLRLFANKLEEEGTQASKRLKERIEGGIPRFEASEEKRKRRDYRMSRKAQFTRPDPGFSLYEGRTRGKRIRYNYSDEEDGTSDDVSIKRSFRGSGISTPAEPAEPTITASGRQVKPRFGQTYGEIPRAGQMDGANSSPDGHAGREGDNVARIQPGPRTRAGRATAGREKYTADKDSDEDGSDASSGNEWNGGDDEELDDDIPEGEPTDDEDDVNMTGSGDEIDLRQEPKSLVVSLNYRRKDKSSPSAKTNELPPGSSAPSQPASAGMPPPAVHVPMKLEVNGDGPATQASISVSSLSPVSHQAKAETDGGVLSNGHAAKSQPVNSESIAASKVKIN